MTRQVDGQFVGLRIVAIGIEALRQRTRHECAAVHLCIIGQIEAHLYRVTTVNRIADSIALRLLTRHQTDFLLTPKRDGRMTNKDLRKRDGFSTSQVRETETQHTAAERHTDGVTQREVLGINGLATVCNRGGIPPTSHPFVVFSHHILFVNQSLKFQNPVPVSGSNFLPIAPPTVGRSSISAV